MTMAYGIEMNVIHVPFKIAFIANLVFIKPALPDRGIAMLDA